MFCSLMYFSYVKMDHSQILVAWVVVFDYLNSFFFSGFCFFFLDFAEIDILDLSCSSSIRPHACFPQPLNRSESNLEAWFVRLWGFDFFKSHPSIRWNYVIFRFLNLRWIMFVPLGVFFGFRFSILLIVKLMQNQAEIVGCRNKSIMFSHNFFKNNLSGWCNSLRLSVCWYFPFLQ